MIHLGLRPVDSPQENATWVHGLETTSVSAPVNIVAKQQDERLEVAIQGSTDHTPIWVAISEGEIVSIQFGQLSDGEIRRTLSLLAEIT